MKKDIENIFDELWPICRSISGDGLRRSFSILNEIIPLNIHEVPSGSKVLDWEVPMEWNIKSAYILSPNGEKLCDFDDNNLHILNYSAPVDKSVSYEELKKHLYTIPEHPEAIPYVTSYYKEKWGFCIQHKAFEKLPKEGLYKVFIDSELKYGSMTYGDLILKGRSEKEILLTSYLCHPSMANNELSGPICLAFLYQKIKNLKDRKYTYRFLICPETIGSIAYLSKYGKSLKENVIAGYVLTCCGDNAPFIYKKSREEDTVTNKVALHILKQDNVEHSVIPFSVGGSDERQFNSPGFNLPMGSLTRSMYHQYKEYHTSLDNKDFISFDSMLETINMYFSFIRSIELNDYFINLNPYGEPNLGKRNLYPSSSEPLSAGKGDHLKLLHILAFSDGKSDLIDISEKINCSLLKLEKYVSILLNENLISRKNA